MADNSAPRVLPVQIPSVAFKGRDTTDASAFRKAAENLPICCATLLPLLMRPASRTPSGSFWVGPISSASPLSSTGGTADEQ